MKLLYCKEKKNENNFNCSFFDIVEFKPSLKGLYLNDEPHNFKTTVVRICFQLMTFGSAKLVCAVSNNGETMHTSYVVPRCFKFNFLSTEDYIIGPCYTAPDYRGQGIYPNILDYITNKIGTENTVFYMCVDENNFSSIRGIEKSGFKKIGTAKKSRFLKRYYIG